MVRWLRWHCPPDTGFEIRALAVWGRARYLSVTEAPNNTDFHTWMGKKHFCFFQTAETGNRTPNSGVKGSSANHYPRAPAPFPESLMQKQTTEHHITKIWYDRSHCHNNTAAQHSNNSQLPRIKIFFYVMLYVFPMSNRGYTDASFLLNNYKKGADIYIVWYQVFHPTFYILPPGYWTCSFVCNINSTESIQSCSHFGALNLSYRLPSLSYQVLIFTWVKWSMWGLSALPNETTSKQCPNIERGETWYFSENPAPSEIRNRMAGSDIDRAARSNHCVVSRSKNKGTHESIGCCSNAWKRPMLYSVSRLEFLLI